MCRGLEFFVDGVFLRLKIKEMYEKNFFFGGVWMFFGIYIYYLEICF